jgi:hypothetical protein
VNIKTLAIAGLLAVVGIGLGSSSDAQAGEYGYPCKTAVSGQYLARSANVSCQFAQAIQRNARAHRYRDPEVLFRVYSKATHRTYSVRMITATDSQRVYRIYGSPGGYVTVIS